MLASLAALVLVVTLALGAPTKIDAEAGGVGDDDPMDVDDDAELEPSEDVPLHSFETTVVTVGKASGKEKRVQKPGFFLRGDDAAAAATRFVYLQSLSLDHVAHFHQVFQHEWDDNVPEDIKPRAKTRRGRSKPMGPRAYLERGKEHAAAGRNDEAHFDYVRAITGEGTGNPELERSQFITEQEMAEAKELLSAHHRKHSRALIAADKAREIKAAAHEREVMVLRERKANKVRLTEDAADFKDAVAKAGWWKRGKKTAAGDDADDSPEDSDSDVAGAGAEGGSGGGSTPLPSPPLHKVSMHLDRGDKNGGKSVVQAIIEAGEDAALAAVEFCATHRLHGADNILQVGLDVDHNARAAGVAVPVIAPTPTTGADLASTVSACISAAREKLDGSEDDGSAAAALLVRAWIRGGAEALASDVQRKIKTDLDVAMRMYVRYRSMYAALDEEDWEKVIEHATEGDKIVPKRKPDALRKLAVARAHWHLGQLTAAERNADRAIAASKKNGDWRRGQIRAVAVSLGASSAIRRGDAETALRFMAFAMRADPDTPLFKKSYKGIKSSQKMLADADIKLDRGESRLAMDASDNAAATIRGLGAADGVGPLFAEIDARRCRAHAQMRAFDHALGACERAATAVGCPHVSSDASESEAKSAESKCKVADPRAYARVLMARAEVHSRDKYPEGALADLRLAHERIQPTAQRGSSEAGRLMREIEGKLHEAEQEKDMHDNNRDHAKMLDLPENIGELPKDRRCEFIKKAFKKAALKWHPDKAMDAGKLRAARKMNEMTEARDHVNERMGCTAPKKDPNEHHHHHHGGHHAHFERMRQQQQQQRGRGRGQRHGGGGGGFGGGFGGHHWEF